MKKRMWWDIRGRLFKDTHGFTMIGTLVAAIAISGITIAGFTMYEYSNKARIVSEKQCTAISLAQASLDYFLTFPYESFPASGTYGMTLPSAYTGYSCTVTVGTETAGPKDSLSVTARGYYKMLTATCTYPSFKGTTKQVSIVGYKIK